MIVTTAEREYLDLAKIMYSIVKFRGFAPVVNTAETLYFYVIKPMAFSDSVALYQHNNFRNRISTSKDYVRQSILFIT